MAIGRASQTWQNFKTPFDKNYDDKIQSGNEKEKPQYKTSGLHWTI